MAIKTFKRYEKKYLLNEVQYNQLTSRLCEYMKPDKHCSNGKWYSIFNIYYDTENNDVIRHSISKPYFKEKLRLRAYKVPTSLEEEVFIELKRKIGGIVSKRRATMTLEEACNFIESYKKTIKEDYINQQVIEEIDYFLKSNDVMPKVCIRYERMAYFAKDNKDFRLTFDRRIKSKRENFFQDDDDGLELLESKQYLMEVKILGAIPVWLTNIFSELKIYSSSFSKYGKDFKYYCAESGNVHESLDLDEYLSKLEMKSIA